MKAWVIWNLVRFALLYAGIVLVSPSGMSWRIFIGGALLMIGGQTYGWQHEKEQRP